MNGTPIMECLFKGIEDEARMCRPARSQSTMRRAKTSITTAT